MQTIGIDIGTTSICGVAVDVQSGKIIKTITKPSNAFIKSDNEWEKVQAVDVILSLAREILDSIITDDTISIGVTGQMHGIVYVDATGNAVSNLYTWQDSRAGLPYKDTTYAKFLGCRTGYGNATDFYNRENGIVPSEAVTYCTIHDYFVANICNLSKPIMHITNAASLGCYDLKSETFSYKNNIDVLNDYKIAGKYKGIPVSIAIGDNQASVLSCLTNENEILINVGTGSQISIISNEIIETDELETRPFFEGKYLVVGAALCGGRAYSILKQFYKAVLSEITAIDDEKVYSIMNDFLKDTTEHKLHVDTRFSGTRYDEAVRGNIYGISEDNFTPAQLTYGFLDGMINELYDMYRNMKTNKLGLVGSGNGLRKNQTLIKVAEEKLIPWSCVLWLLWMVTESIKFF